MPYDIEDYREDQYKDFQASLNDEQEEEKTFEEAIEEFSEEHCLDIDSVTAEWEAVKENYNNEIWKYLNEMARRGDFDAHLA